MSAKKSSLVLDQSIHFRICCAFAHHTVDVREESTGITADRNDVELRLRLLVINPRDACAIRDSFGANHGRWDSNYFCEERMNRCCAPE